MTEFIMVSGLDEQNLDDFVAVGYFTGERDVFGIASTGWSSLDVVA